MNILLDYIMPISSIEPTPEASTAFLKQVCVIGLPKDGGVTAGVITLITTAASASTYFGTDAAAEVAKLFSGGLSRVYVLPLDDLGDAADALEGHGSDFYTVLLTSDFVDADISSTSGGIKSSLKIQDITYTAKSVGTAGDSITINYNTGGTAGSEVVSVVGSAISVAMQDGVSTADNIRDAIENSVSASLLVDLTVDTGDENDVQAVFGAAVNLAGGAAASEGDLDFGDFEGVIGVSSTDDTFLAEQGAIEKRSAWHTTSTNKAKNMFYAFGKMLSNTLNWSNQQYITMTLADDVDTLGEAETLFDDKINFVIDDDEFGPRLGLFVAGGQAIAAPYIKRNLQIDLQSEALQYISANQPGYTKTQAALLEDELQKVINERYIDTGWIEDGTVEVELLEDNFVASGNINIANPGAMWRLFAEMRATL